mgnify:CR=1 FL=1
MSKINIVKSFLKNKRYVNSSWHNKHIWQCWCNYNFIMRWYICWHSVCGREKGRREFWVDIRHLLIWDVVTDYLCTYLHRKGWVWYVYRFLTWLAGCVHVEWMLEKSLQLCQPPPQTLIHCTFVDLRTFLLWHAVIVLYLFGIQVMLICLSNVLRKPLYIYVWNWLVGLPCNKNSPSHLQNRIQLFTLEICFMVNLFYSNSHLRKKNDDGIDICVRCCKSVNPFSV